MWSFALYNLRISHEVFWQLTPRQFSLISDRHREHLAHREMCHAFTTAAVVNHSFSPPEKPIPPSEWMPHYEQPNVPPSVPATAEQLEAKAAFDGQSFQLSLELKAYAETGAIGPALKRLGYGESMGPAGS